MRVAYLALLVLPLVANATEPPPAAELVAASIAHHDPQGVWGSGAIELHMVVRYDGEFAASRGITELERTRDVLLAPGQQRYRMVERRDGHEISYAMDGGEQQVLVDGEPATDAQRQELGLRDPAGYRDYHEYMHGVPMKLADPGTRIAPQVTPMQFDGRDVWAVRVTYDEAVGSDVWDFFFDPATRALVGCRFYHDEAANDGEFITMRGQVVDEATGLRLPAELGWYFNDGGGHLATDTVEIVGVSP